MKKIVINGCFGGFGLSEVAMLEYARLKGLKIYVEDDVCELKTYWTIPSPQRPLKENWYTMTLEERQKYNKAVAKSTISYMDIPRDDKDLVIAIETLGKEANGSYAALTIVEIPDDVEWQIEEYDGNEWVSEKHRTWHGREG